MTAAVLIAALLLIAFQSLSGLTLCCDVAIVPVRTIVRMFQSLSGLTLCCDDTTGMFSPEINGRFQSLSGLTLCCDFLVQRGMEGRTP